MNWNQIESNWEHLKGNIQYQWAKLTDDDLEAIGGKREELAGKIQETYSINEDEAEKQISNWQKNHLANPDDEDLELQMYYSAIANSVISKQVNNFDNEFDDDDGIQEANGNPLSNKLYGMGDIGNDSKSHGSKGHGDGANPEAGESTEMNDTGNPKPNPNSNPMPNSTDKQPRDSDNETPHEDKSLDQT